MKQYSGQVINSLITNAVNYMDTNEAINKFYDYVYNIKTARGFGLDIWGRILGQNRFLQTTAEDAWFGFNDAVGFFPFDDGVFFASENSTSNYRLSDESFRTLIIVRAFSNLSQTTIPNMNYILTTIFSGRGKVYVVDEGNMEIKIVFGFGLRGYEKAIVSSDAVPHPCGVKVRMQYIDATKLLGFDGSLAQPLGQGAFFNSEVVDAN